MKFFKCHSQKMKDDKVICLEDKFTDIGPDVFSGFAVEYIILANTTKVLRNYAFAGLGKCSIYLPKSIEEIEPLAFESIDANTVFFCVKGSYAEEVCIEQGLVINYDTREIFSLVEEQKKLVEEQRQLVAQQQRILEEQKQMLEQQRLLEEQIRKANEERRREAEKAEAERKRAEAERIEAERKKAEAERAEAEYKRKEAALQADMCPFCKKKLLESDMFCPYCGRKVKNIKICKKCGEPNDLEDNFCENCGAAFESATRNNLANTTGTIVPNTSGILTTGIPSGKNKIVAGILGLLLGGFGIHKFYMGKIGMGLLYLIFFWTYIPSIVGFVEGIMYLIEPKEKFNARCARRRY